MAPKAHLSWIRMIREHMHFANALGIVSRVLVILLVIVAVAAAGLAWRLASGPLTLNILSGSVRDRIAHAVGPQAEVNLDAIVLAWTADGGPRIRLRGVVLSDKGTGFEASLPTTDVRLNGFDLLLGTLSPTQIHVYSPRLGVPVQEGSSTAPDILLEYADHALKGIGSSTRSIGLTEIRIEDATVALHSTDPEGHGRLYSDVSVTLAFDHAKNTTKLDIAGIGFGGAWTASATHGPEEETDGSVLKVKGVDITLDDLMGVRTGAATVSVFRLPLYPEFTARYDHVGRLRGAAFDLTVGAGYVEAGGEAHILDEARVAVLWVPEKRAFKIEPSRIEFGETHINFTGIVTPPRSGDQGKWSFGIESRNSIITPKNADDAPVTLDHVVMGGTVDPDIAFVDVERFGVKIGRWVIGATGSFDNGDFGPKLSVSGALDAIPVDVLKTVWPPFIAPPARKWLLANVEGGGDVDASFRAMIGKAELDGDPATGGWGDDDLDISFKVRGARVKTFGELPSINAKSATGRIKGGELRVEMASGSVTTRSGGTVRLSNSVFEIPDIRVKPQTAKVRFSANGPMRNVGEVVNAKPIEAIRKVGVAPADLSGNAVADVSATFRLKKELPFKEVDWALTARLEKFASRKEIGGNKISDASLTLTVDGQSAEIKGKAKIDGTVASVDLIEPLDGSGKGSSKVGIKLRLTDEDRRKKGMKLAHLLTGPIDVSINAAGDKLEKYDIDLTDARLTVAEIGWTKPAGVPAKVQFATDKSQPGLIKDLQITGKALSIAGALKLDDDGSLQSAKFDRLKLGGTDVDSMKIIRTREAGFDVAFAAKTLDARALVTDAMGRKSKKKKDAEDENLRIRGTVRRLIGHNSTVLTGVDIDARVVAGRMNALDLSGVSGNRDRLHIRVAPQGGQRNLEVNTQNTGDLLRFLNLYKQMQGGDGRLSATLVGPNRSTGRIRIRNFRVSEDKALRELVKRGNFDAPTNDSRPLNIRPIAETGDAVFEKIVVKFAVNGDQMKIGDALLKGTVIGGTMKGDIDFARKRLSITGTMVPAYGINNLFGRIPLLGGALGGGRNGGLIGVTFKMSGPIGNTKMSVNPLSAVTPGIFRRIFEFD